MNETNKTNLNRTGIKKTNIGEGISPNHRRNESISMRNLLKDKCWRMDLFSKVPTSRKQKRIRIRTEPNLNQTHSNQSNNHSPTKALREIVLGRTPHPDHMYVPYQLKQINPGHRDIGDIGAGCD